MRPRGIPEQRPPQQEEESSKDAETCLERARRTELRKVCWIFVPGH